MNSYIKDIAYYVPEQILTNDDLSKLMDTSDEWIKTRTGISQRHTVGNTNLGPSDLAVNASNKLLNKLNFDKSDIDFVVFATSTPDYYIPGSGCLLQEKMGFKEIGALDIRVQCSGFLYGLLSGYDTETCCKMGSVAAAEVISHIGPRPQQDVKALFAEKGLI